MLTDEDLQKIAALLEEYGLKKPEVRKAEGAAERMRRYRDRMRNTSVTKRNGKRNGTQREKRNASVTERNADVTGCECAADAVVSIPLNDGSEYGIGQAAVTEFEKLYPRVDVPQTLREMRGWCIANPTKRKTKVGVMRFVNFWLAREQNKGG